MNDVRTVLLSDAILEDLEIKSVPTLPTLEAANFSETSVIRPFQ
jgi:hypothetical protein